MKRYGREQWDNLSSVVPELEVNLFQREMLSQVILSVARRCALHSRSESSGERQLGQGIPLSFWHKGLMYHELVAREIQVLQRSHGHEREGDGCPISADNGIPAKDVIDAFWVVGCGTKWEGVGHEATELLILPDDASPLRVSELDAIAAGLVGAAASAFRCEFGGECVTV